MKTNRPSKLKVLLTAVAVSGALVFGGARESHADPITAAVLAGFVVVAATPVIIAGAAVAVVGTYAAAKATVCTPVAGIRAWDHAAGFGGVFKECWDWSPFSKQPGSTESGASEQSARIVERRSPEDQGQRE